MAEADDAGAGGGTQRLDKWLCYARFAKTRTVAAEMVEGGRVRVNREKVRSGARPLKPGDILTLRLPRDVAVVRVVGFAERRVSPHETVRLYETVAEDGD